MTIFGFLSSPVASYQQLLEDKKLTPDPAQARVVVALERLHQGLMGYEPPSRITASVFSLLPIRRKQAPMGLYIHGDVGRGKSMLMDLFFESAPTKRKRRMHFHAFIQDVHARVHKVRAEQREDHDPILPVARQLRDEAFVWCLDEFEVHDIADAMLFSRLFTLLLKRGVVMVMTSNRAPHGLYPNGLQRERFIRFIDLMVQRVEVLNLDSPTDYRHQKLQSMEAVYDAPLGEAADRFIESHFRRLSAGLMIGSKQLSVQGRTLTLPRTAEGIAYSSFEALCEQPLAAPDYLAIAGNFHTLFLSDIPCMTPEQRNEARRFVMLVDALYDHRVKLICTADGPPESLYKAGTGSEEFYRTVSRLTEMQSKEYLAQPHLSDRNHG